MNVSCCVNRSTEQKSSSKPQLASVEYWCVLRMYAYTKCGCLCVVYICIYIFTHIPEQSILGRSDANECTPLHRRSRSSFHRA